MNQDDTIQYMKHSETYPYLIIRAMSAVYVRKYSKIDTGDKQALVAWAKSEATQYCRRVCLVWSPDETVYIGADGEMEAYAPVGGILLTS